MMSSSRADCVEVNAMPVPSRDHCATAEMPGAVPSCPKSRQSSATSKVLVPAGESVHPLQSKWFLYVLLPSEKRTEESWRDQQIAVHDFDTVEDFWCMYHYIHPPSQIGMSDYSLFKKDILPAWEDPALAQGGRWVVKFPPKMKRVDDAWLELVLAMIGENFRSVGGECIAGAVASIRVRSQKLALWIGRCNEKVILDIGREFRGLLAPILEPTVPSSPMGPQANRQVNEMETAQGDVKGLEATFEPFNGTSPRYVISYVNGNVVTDTIAPES